MVCDYLIFKCMLYIIIQYLCCCVVYMSYIYLHIYFLFICFVFFFKQKTAYEMRISDWSSDVCSSDLAVPGGWRKRPRRFHDIDRAEASKSLASSPAHCRSDRYECLPFPVIPIPHDAIIRAHCSRKKGQGLGKKSQNCL